MNCQYCNCPVPPGVTQCPGCGASLSAQPQYVQRQYAAASQYQQPVGSKFQLMPGERLLVRGSFNRKVGIFWASTYMRLTDQRLVFCHISSWLTYGLSWLFCFMEASKISQSFTRSDIVHMEIKRYLLKKVIVITDHFGKTYTFCPQFGCCDAVIVNWWQNGNMG